MKVMFLDRGQQTMASIHIWLLLVSENKVKLEHSCANAFLFAYDHYRPTVVELGSFSRDPIDLKA